MFRLNEAETRSLLNQPETGMGYQVVEATRKDNTIERGIAYNAELLFLGNETQNDLRLHSYERVLKMAQNSGNEIRALRVLPREKDFWLSKDTRSASAVKAGAKESPKEKTKEGEVFKRFSAYENDRRVTADKRLLPESYATTEADAKNVKTGADAVARYALPNPEPASYRFTIKPDKDTEIQRGIAEPANSQPGGGVEVFFGKGTQVDSVTVPPDHIPDK